MIVSLLIGATTATDVLVSKGLNLKSSVSDNAEIMAGKEATLLDEENAKCYRARYYDIDSNMSSIDHYNKIGKKQGRHYGCGKRLTDNEVMKYIQINPEFSSEFGTSGENVYEFARAHFSKYGRHETHNSMLKLNSPRQCAKGHGNCRCKGSAYIGYAKRPDTGEEIKDFETFNLFNTAKLTSDKKTTYKCNSKTFGKDVAPGDNKQCFCESISKPSSEMCALQGGDCSCPAGTKVVYGTEAGFKFKKKQNKDGERALFQQALKRQFAVTLAPESGTLKCDGSSFNGVDPLPNKDKACFCDSQGQLKQKRFDNKKRYWENKQKKLNAKKVREAQKKALTAATRETQKVVQMQATQVQQASQKGTKSPACGEKCTYETAKQQEDLKKIEVTNKMKNQISEIENKINQQKEKKIEAENKKKSAEGVKSVADSNATPAEQTKLKTEFETLNNEANSAITESETEIQRLTSELTKTQYQLSVEVTEIEEETKISVDEGIQKVKLQDSKNTQEKSKIEINTNKAKEVAITEEISAQKVDQKAIEEQIDSSKHELTEIEEEIKELYEEKEQNDNSLTNIDGGAAVEAEKATELGKAITESQTKLSQIKTEAAAETAKITAEQTKVETEVTTITTTIDEKKSEVEKAKKDLDKHRVEQQEAINSLERNPKNATAQKAMELNKEQIDIDKKIVTSAEKSLEKSLVEKSNAESKITELTEKALNVTQKLENQTIEVQQEITYKTEVQVGRVEEVAVNTATQAKGEQLSTKLVSDAQTELVNQIGSTLNKIEKQVATNTQNHNTNIEHSKEKIAELTTRQKTVTESTTLDAKTKVKEIAKIASEIAKTQDKIVEETAEITNDKTKVAEIKTQLATEKAKQVTLNTASTAAEKVYTTSVKSNKATHEAELTEVTTKATTTKATAETAAQTASTVKVTEEKVIETIKTKTKTCQQKLKEAQNKQKLLVTQRSQLVEEINKLLASATGKAQAATKQAKVTEIDGLINAQKAIVDENTACVATGVSEEAASREKIVVAKDTATEAIIEAQHAAQTRDLVQAQVNQSIEIEKQMSKELQTTWNQTDESVKTLIKEQVSVATKKKEEQHKIKETITKIERGKSQITDLKASVTEKETKITQLEDKLKDPKEAPNVEIIKSEIENTKSEKVNEESLITVTEQTVNKAIKTKNELKESIKKETTEQIEINQKIEELKFELAQNSSDKEFISTKINQDKVKAENEIATQELVVIQANETKKDLESQIGKTYKSVEEHTKTLQEQEQIKNQLTTQVAALKEAAASKAIPDTADQEEIAATTAKLNEVTSTVAQEKTEVENQQTKITDLTKKKQATEVAIKEANEKTKNANKKIDTITTQIKQIDDIKSNSDKAGKELKQQVDIAVAKAEDATKNLEETMLEKTELTSTLTTLTTKEQTEKKKLTDLQSKKEVVQTTISTSTTMTPEDIADAQAQITQIDNDIKKVQEEHSITETEKSITQEKITKIQPEITEKQQAVTETTKEADTQKATIAEVTATTQAQNDEVITETISENQEIVELITELETQKTEVKTDIESAITEKTTIDSNLNNDQVELSKAVSAQKNGEIEAKFATCQSVYYSLPATQRQELFSYPKKQENSPEKCPNTMLNPTLQVYIHVEKSKIQAVLKTLMTLSLNKEIESVQGSYKLSSVVPNKDASIKTGYRMVEQEDKESAIIVVDMPGSASFCATEDLFQKNFESDNSNLNYVVVQTYSKEALPVTV